MTGWFIQIVGVALVLLGLADVFLTVLHSRGDAGLLSTRLNRVVWLATREASRVAGRRSEAIRAYAGPVALVLTVGMWLALITLGFALIVWPDLGSSIRSPVGANATDFVMALYYSGSGLTTVGLGDLIPYSSATRLALLTEAVLGISLVTLSITYFLSIFNAIIRRNAFAQEVDYMTARTGDAAELLVRIGSKGEFDSTARTELSLVGRELLVILQSHHAFPVIHLFAQGSLSVAPTRVALVALDTASLVRSALDRERYADFIDSAAIEVLWDGGMKLLFETGHDILGDTEHRVAHPNQAAWEARYDAACERLRRAGFATAPDVEDGRAAYARQRRRWDGQVRAFARYRGHDWAQLDCAVEAAQRQRASSAASSSRGSGAGSPR